MFINKRGKCLQNNKRDNYLNKLRLEPTVTLLVLVKLKLFKIQTTTVLIQTFDLFIHTEVLKLYLIPPAADTTLGSLRFDNGERQRQCHKSMISLVE